MKKLKLGKLDFKPMDAREMKKVMGGVAPATTSGDLGSLSLSASLSATLSAGLVEVDIEVEAEGESDPN